MATRTAGQATRRVRGPQLRAVALSGTLLGALLWAAPAIAADVVASSLYVSKSGDTVTYNATVCGGPGKKTDPFKIGLWFNSTSTPACNAVPDYEWSSLGLANNDCQSFSYVRSGVPMGSYTARIFADRQCLIAETDELNNHRSSVYSVGPDLSILSFTSTLSGTTVTFSISVRNNGTSISAPFNVGLWYNLSANPLSDCSTPPSPPSVTLPVASLAAATTTTLTHVWTGVTNGSYRSVAFADMSCAISETSETNNISYRYTYLGPNIYLYLYTPTISGTSVTYSVQVYASSSSVNVPPYTIALWYNRSTAPTCNDPTPPDHVWTDTVGLTAGYVPKTFTHTRATAPAGTFTMWAMADPTCALAETQETDNTRSKIYSVGAPGPADLYLSSFTATAAGTDVTYKATVCNQGGTSAGAFSVGLAYNTTAAPACPFTPSYTWSVTGLGAGVCTTLSYTRTGVAAGSYLAWVLADSACVITEALETNNTKSASYAIGQPELTIGSFSAAVTGNQVSYSVQVCNSGTTAAPAFAVGIYGDRASAPDCSVAPAHTLPVTGLAGGACTTLTASDSNVGTGTKQAWAFADHLCQIAEGNETNNQKSYGYGVGVESSDLRVTTMSVVATGSRVTYQMTVCNGGSTAAAASELGLYYDKTAAPACGDTADWSVSLLGLAPGECDTRTHVRENAAAGTFKAWAKADDDCAIGESDETNNTASHGYTVTVQTLDLSVTSLTTLVANDSVTAVAQICNTGAVKTEATSAGFFADRTDPPAEGCADTPDQKSSVKALEIGECQEVTFVRQKVAAGSYTAWVVADAECAVTEGDETNNAASKAYVVGGGGNPDAGPSGSDAVAGETGTTPRPPPKADGCGCVVPGAGGGAAGSLMLLVLLLLGWRRRR